MTSIQYWTLRSEFREDWALLRPILWDMVFVLAAIGLGVVICNIIVMRRENKK